MVGNPYRWRATISQLENRNATAGCLLAVLFVVPYLAKSGGVSIAVLCAFVFVYVTLVVPLLSGIVTGKQLVSAARTGVNGVRSLENWYYLLQQVDFLIRWSHSVYLNLDGIHITVMQVVFNMAAEKLLCPDQRLASLYVLLFYSVLAYLQRALQARPWVQLLNESSTAEFLKLTTAFIIVRLGKGVAMSLVLLTFTLQFNHMEPSVSFVALTFSVFCLTQYQKHPLVKAVQTHWLRILELQWLEGMEELYVPLFYSLFVIAISMVIGTACILTTDSYIVVLILCYTNIIVPWIQMCRDSWKPLVVERATLSAFPVATWKNRVIRSGGLCAICLDKLRMLSARVTPCGHVFHGACLRTSLHYSQRCPLCKSALEIS